MEGQFRLEREQEEYIKMVLKDKLQVLKNLNPPKTSALSIEKEFLEKLLEDLKFIF